MENWLNSNLPPAGKNMREGGGGAALDGRPISRRGEDRPPTRGERVMEEPPLLSSRQSYVRTPPRGNKGESPVVVFSCDADSQFRMGSQAERIRANPTVMLKPP